MTQIKKMKLDYVAVIVTLLTFIVVVIYNATTIGTTNPF